MHDVSHLIFARDRINARPHGGAHADLELAMVRHVVDKGWLSGALKPKPKPTKAPDRAAKIQAAIDRWERKRRRAETALRKHRRMLARHLSREAKRKEEARNSA